MFVSDGTGRQTPGGSKLCLKSRIPGRWVKSSSCVHRKHTRLYILGAAMWKTSQEMLHNEGKRDWFWQQVSGCCFPEPLQWMLQIDVSSGREKVNINNGAAPVRDSPRNIVERSWSVLQCDHHGHENSPTCPRPKWATSAPSQAWVPRAASCPCARQEHISPTTCTRDVQRENQKVTLSIPPLYPCCETDPCAGMTKENWGRAARAQRDWNRSPHLTDKWPDFRVLITHHFAANSKSSSTSSLRVRQRAAAGFTKLCHGKSYRCLITAEMLQR